MATRGGFGGGNVRVRGVVDRTGGGTSQEVNVNVLIGLVKALFGSDLRPIGREEPAWSLIESMAE